MRRIAIAGVVLVVGSCAVLVVVPAALPSRVAVSASAPPCPLGDSFVRAHSSWQGKIIQPDLGVSGCGAVFTGGVHKRGEAGCRPKGKIRVAVWGTFVTSTSDHVHVDVKAFVERKQNGKWVGASTTGLRWAADTRAGHGAMLPTTVVDPTAPSTNGLWLKFHADHAWGVTGSLDGEVVRVHVVVRWRADSHGPDIQLQKLDERVGHYCTALADDEGAGGLHTTPPLS